MDASSFNNQLRIDADPITAPTNAALQDVPNAEFSTHLAQINPFALVSETRIARDHEQVGKAGKLGDNVFRNSVGKVLLLRVATHILKGQDSYRWLVGKRKRRL